MSVLIDVEVEMSLLVQLEQLLECFANVRVRFGRRFDPRTRPVGRELLAERLRDLATCSFVEFAAHEQNRCLSWLIGLDFTYLAVDRLQLFERLFTGDGVEKHECVTFLDTQPLHGWKLVCARSERERVSHSWRTLVPLFAYVSVICRVVICLLQDTTCR